LPQGSQSETNRLDHGRTTQRAKYTGMHALRHFYASWCLNPKRAGGLELPPKVVQERMGPCDDSHDNGTCTGISFPVKNDARQLAKAERLLLG